MINASAQKIERIRRRNAGIPDWLRENHPECFREQLHADEGSRERVYWHYGYSVAIMDILRLLEEPDC